MHTNGVRPTFKPLSLVPDSSDLELHKLNCSAELVTRRLRDLVPLLETVDCIVEEMGPEKTVLSLPMLVSAMNQNGTHQASVFYLARAFLLSAREGLRLSKIDFPASREMLLASR